MTPTDTGSAVRIPECVGVILDGNRRWARERGLNPYFGHNAGYKKLKEFVRWAQEAGIQWIVAYAFSIENWKRSEEEVSYLMKLILQLFRDDIQVLKKEGVRIRVAGERSLLPKEIQDVAQLAEDETKENNAITLVLALSYGGRDEIVSAINKLLADAGPSSPKAIDKEEFARCLWTADMPDPDLIIRTSGEMRLSNFLSWQSAYSELFFPKVFWPDFSKDDFISILKEYGERERRYGQ